MVKLGFIVEGDTEKIILEKSDFFSYLNSMNIEFIAQVINAAGNSNLLPHNIGRFVQTLTDFGASHIFILTDLDNNKCMHLSP